jgi:hypothetical protein
MHADHPIIGAVNAKTFSISASGPTVRSYRFWPTTADLCTAVIRQLSGLLPTQNAHSEDYRP